MTLITPIDVLGIGKWYEIYCRTGNAQKFDGKVLVVDSLDGKVNGYDNRVNVLKGHLFYPVAVEDIFRRWYVDDCEI